MHHVTRPGIELWSPEPLVNTLPNWSMDQSYMSKQIEIYTKGSMHKLYIKGVQNGKGLLNGVS